MTEKSCMTCRFFFSDTMKSATCGRCSSDFRNWEPDEATKKKIVVVKESPKCDPCDGGSIDCAHCEHLATAPPSSRPTVIALAPLDKQVGGGHYKSFKIQPIEFAAANGLSFIEGNVVKYAVRRKGDKAKRLEDLRKAVDCLEKLIDFVERDICS